MKNIQIHDIYKNTQPLGSHIDLCLFLLLFVGCDRWGNGV